MTRNTFYLASTYGSGAYNECNYSGTNTHTNCVTSTPNGGTLSNTGFDVLLIVSIACALLLAALVVRIWKRPSKKQQASQSTDEESKK